VVNCTIADNGGWGIYGSSPGTGTVVNTIVWTNSAGGIHGNVNATITYSDTQESHAGEGHFSADPEFAAPGERDYHLKSTVGRWTPGGWVKDEVQSPCIDAGDLAFPVGNERLFYNGGRINAGRFGGTPEASLSTPRFGGILILR